ncbi:MAG: phosphatidylglycerophosphatase A [Proteobacteria bacterium]|nr:phosphatidylglycerophosphatase A [Pseudomonadota bacterium]MDA0994523.1 phosphatidylglycerophosphatase A [Pseudomonadota bacterium]
MRKNANNRKLARTVVTDPVHFLAFGFGAGLLPWAPGTFGSIPGLLLAWITLPLSMEWKLMVASALVMAGIWVCGESARRLGIHDHPGIVWDEITGMYLTLLVAPTQIAYWALAFALFRLFDIWKPWPIRDLDHRMAGGVGIMLDDLVAALYAAILLAFAGWFIG